MRAGLAALRALARLFSSAVQLVWQQADQLARRRLAAAMMLVVVGAMLAAAAPLALKALIDILATVPASDGAPALALTLAGAYLLTLGAVRLLAELRPLLTAQAEQSITARLSQRFLAHALSLPMARHRAGHTGATSQTLSQAMTGCQLLTTTLVNSMAPVVVEVGAVLVVLLHIDQPKLVASFAATALAYLGLCAAGALRLQQRAREVSEASLRSRAVLSDTLGQVEALKCFSAEGLALGRFREAVTTLQLRWLALYRQRARTGTALTLIFTVSMAGSLGIAIHAYSAGTLSIGGFVLVTVYLLQLIRPLELLGGATRELAEALEFIRPLMNMLRETPEDVAGGATEQTTPGTTEPKRLRPATRPAGRGSPTIVFSGVHMAYDTGCPVLRGLDLELTGGRTLALVGPSGSGKSSIARLLLRLVEPQAGTISLDGDPLGAVPLVALRSMITLVPQDITLMDGSLRDNILLSHPGASDAAVEAAARAAQLHHVVTSLPQGYDTRVGERGLRLSGGERQRVAIARMLLRPASLCVIDEGTSMLDPATEHSVMTAVAAACAGRTTLLIAHRLSNLRWADEVAVLDRGRVVERGTHDALMQAGGAYARLWRDQSCAGGRAMAKPLAGAG